MQNQDLIRQAAALLKQSQKIAVLTGAGVSKESGVPTFRDAQTGLWEKYDPQQLATPHAFKQNPKLVWDWYEFRRGMVRQARPNPGHMTLAELEKTHPHLHIITQNVDDLHEQAGSRRVIHLHGNIAQNKCFDDCRGQPTLVDITGLDWDVESGPPSCPYCAAWVRPDVVWFGEMLPKQALIDAQNISQGCDVMIVIGTSGLVTPAATMPQIAKAAGATVIEINPDESALTRLADFKLQGPSGEILPQVIKAMADA